MTDIFIKNNRRKAVQEIQNKAYTPEYKRLGVVPQESRAADPSDFEKHAEQLKAEKKSKQRNQQLISLVQKYRDGEISKEDMEDIFGTEVLEDATIEKKIEKAVSVGQNEDLVWTQDRTIARRKVYDEPIEVEEVEDPPEQLTPAQQALEDDDEDEGFSFSQIKTEEYILVNEDEVVGIGSKKKIVALLSELLENSEDVEVSDFILLKRVNLKYGLLVDEGV
jgi:hypothetical protein